MTLDATSVRARIVLAASEIEWAVEKLERIAGELDGHDQQAAVFLGEQAAVLRSSISQLREQARHIAATPGSIVN